MTPEVLVAAGVGRKDENLKILGSGDPVQRGVVVEPQLEGEVENGLAHAVRPVDHVALDVPA